MNDSEMMRAFQSGKQRILCWRKTKENLFVFYDKKLLLDVKNKKKRGKDKKRPLAVSVAI